MITSIGALDIYIITVYIFRMSFSFAMNLLQVSLPSFSLGLPAYYILAVSESSSNLSRYDGIRSVAEPPFPISLPLNTHTTDHIVSFYVLVFC